MKYFIASFLLLLAGCSSFKPLADSKPVTSETTPNHPVTHEVLEKEAPLPAIVCVDPNLPVSTAEDQQSALLKQAICLTKKIEKHQMTRMQVAHELNRYRLRIIGANAVDDKTFDMYKRLAKARDHGNLNSSDSQMQMENYLHDLMRDWMEMPKKANYVPVFSNFILKLYRLPALK